VPRLDRGGIVIKSSRRVKWVARGSVSSLAFGSCFYFREVRCMLLGNRERESKNAMVVVVIRSR
jgi:hypothetical protein